MYKLKPFYGTVGAYKALQVSIMRSGIAAKEAISSHELFKEIISAINENNADKLAVICKEHPLHKYYDLPFISDEAGDTIAHHICLSGNLFFAKLLLMGRELFFMPSFYIQNNENKKPIDCVAGGHNDFLEKIKINFMSKKPNFSQLWIMDQFKLYLFYQAKHNPKEYSYDRIVRIMKKIRKGLCFGFSSVWAKTCLKMTYQAYPNLLLDIISWDRSYHSLNDSLAAKFETAISLIRAHQDFPFEILEDTKLLTLGLFSTALQTQKDFKYKFNSEMTEEARTPEELVNSWGKELYQVESYITLRPNIMSDIGDYFKIFLTKENNGKVLVIYSQQHWTTCYFNNNKLYYYDSNDETPLEELEEHHNCPFGRVIDATQDSCIEEIVSLLDKSFTPANVTEYDLLWGCYPLCFYALDLKGKEIGHYPIASELRADWEEKANIRRVFSAKNKI